MNKINWIEYKFHSSSVGNLMAKSRVKDELSETTKSYLRELWVQEVWGRQKIEMIGNKYTTKGIMCETDSISLYERVSGITCFKNNIQLENEFIVGTPDIKKPNLVDVKSSWDLYTFMAVDEKKALKDYYYQLMSYMWLTGQQESELAYCLVNTPNILINDELYRLSFKLPEDKVDQHKVNFVFDDIPEERRVKRYKILYDETVIEKMRLAITTARGYLQILDIENGI